jgi:hypothetical protein
MICFYTKRMDRVSDMYCFSYLTRISIELVDRFFVVNGSFY